MFTNLATNPSMESTSGTVEVRRNLCFNPSFETAISGSSAAGTGGTVVESRETTGGYSGTSFRRTTWTTGTSVAGTGGLAGGGTVPTASVPITVGTTYTLSAYVRTSAATSLVARADWVGGPGAIPGVVTATPAGVWTRVSVTATAPAGSTGVNLALLSSGVPAPSWATGATLDVDAILIEASPALGQYFDGSFSPDSDLTPSWTGTANASASILTGKKVVGITGGIQSGQWAADGTQSLRVDTGTATVPVTGPVTITARAAGQTATLAGVSITSTAAGEALVLTGTGTLTLGTGWWDKIGDGITQWFSGATPNSPERIYAWTGPADASTSTSTPTVPVTLVGSGTPQDVQIIIPGLLAGQTYHVEGIGAGATWTVRGGRGTSTGATLILGDTQTPLNVPVTYRVTVNNVTLWTSEPVTVAAPEKYALQSLDGNKTAIPRLMSNGLPRSLDVRTASFAIPGRPRPVVRMDTTGDGGGQLLIDTTGTETGDLYDLLAAGRPIVIRTDGTVRDMATVDVVLVTDVSSVLTDARIQDGDTRRWTLTYLLIDDPDPDAILSLSTWDDFDAVYAGQSWTAFDTQWSGSTWDDFDRFDWEGQA